MIILLFPIDDLADVIMSILIYTQICRCWSLVVLCAILSSTLAASCWTLVTDVTFNNMVPGDMRKSNGDQRKKSMMKFMTFLAFEWENHGQEVLEHHSKIIKVNQQVNKKLKGIFA